MILKGKDVVIVPMEDVRAILVAMSRKEGVYGPRNEDYELLAELDVLDVAAALVQALREHDEK